MLSLGENIFLKRMGTLDFDAWAGLTKVQKALNLINNIGLISIAAKVILSLKGWNPIIFVASAVAVMMIVTTAMCKMVVSAGMTRIEMAGTPLIL